MAGTYPDVPGRRMAYDRDGSVGFYIQGGVVTTLTSAEIESMNDDDDSAVYSVFMNNPPVRQWGLVFPELRDIAGYYIAARATAGDPSSLQTSPNTTNGLDGTWTTVVASLPGDFSTDPVKMRQNIATASFNGVKGIRFTLGGGDAADNVSFRAWHLYGSPSSGSAPNRLLFYDPASAAQVGGAYFDWGDIPRGSTVSRSFRIHNPSATLTANSVVVSMEALTDTSPSNTGQHEFSVDGGTTWAATAVLGNLAPGATSSVIILRRNTSASAVLSLWSTRMVASASSWT